MKSKNNTFKSTTKYTSLSFSSTAEALELRAGSGALHSAIHLERPEKLALKNLEYLAGILLFIPAPRNILILGTGGGSLLHFLHCHYPQSKLTTVEIDAELLLFAQQNMRLPEASEHLSYVIDDAANFVRHSPQQYDLILVDIFNGTQMPDWISSIEHMQLIHSRLTEQGAIGYNLLIDSDHDFNQYCDKLNATFENRTLYFPVEGFDNTIAYGFRHQPGQQTMTDYMNLAIELGEVHDINYIEVLSTIYSTNPVGSGII